MRPMAYVEKKSISIFRRYKTTNATDVHPSNCLITPWSRRDLHFKMSNMDIVNKNKYTSRTRKINFLPSLADHENHAIH